MAAAGKITADLRGVLENLWGEGKTLMEIARALGVHPASVSREVGRNHSGRHGWKNPLGAAGVGCTCAASGRVGRAEGAAASAPAQAAQAGGCLAAAPAGRGMVAWTSSARSRSRPGCVWTFLIDRRCGWATKPSTRASTCRAGAACESWSTMRCAPVARPAGPNPARLRPPSGPCGVSRGSPRRCTSRPARLR